MYMDIYFLSQVCPISLVDSSDEWNIHSPQLGISANNLKQFYGISKYQLPLREVFPNNI